MKKLIPLLDRVLIQRAEAITKTAGGIVIPEKAQGKVLKGTVIAVGPGARNQVSLRIKFLTKTSRYARLSRFRPAKTFRWASKSATTSCFPNSAAPRSSSKIKRSTSCSESRTSSPKWNINLAHLIRA